MTTETYHVHTGLIPDTVIEEALRRVWLELRLRGATAEQIAEWASNSWFPHLRGEPEFNDVRWHLRVFMEPGDQWAETQILVRLPDVEGTPLGEPHIDTLPPWADGQEYRAIYGVELSHTEPHGGHTILYPSPHSHGLHVRQNQGDVLEMTPGMLHSGSPNAGAEPRVALFFRLLKKVDDDGVAASQEAPVPGS